MIDLFENDDGVALLAIVYTLMQDVHCTCEPNHDPTEPINLQAIRARKNHQT